MESEIREKLKELPLTKVYYGAIPAKETLKRYDYAVFAKAKTGYGGTSRTKRYKVAVVMENFIPENFIEETVIPKLEEIRGVKFDKSADIEYIQSVRQNTATTLELALFFMTVAERRC